MEYTGDIKADAHESKVKHNQGHCVFGPVVVKYAQKGEDQKQPDERVAGLGSSGTHTCQTKSFKPDPVRKCGVRMHISVGCVFFG